MSEVRVPTHALSIMQPWASAIVVGSKRIGNRTWRPFQIKDGPFAIWIHASAKPDRDPDGDAIEQFLEMRIGGAFAPPWGLSCGAIIGAAVVERVIDERPADYAQSRWWVGPLAWVLRDVVALHHPVKARGRLSLWRPTPEVQAACVERLPSQWVGR